MRGTKQSFQIRVVSEAEQGAFVHGGFGPLLRMSQLREALF